MVYFFIIIQALHAPIACLILNFSLRSLTLCLLIGDITTQQIGENTAHPLFTQFVAIFPVMILCHPYCRKLDWNICHKVHQSHKFQQADQ